VGENAMSRQIPEYYPPPDKRMRPDMPLVPATAQTKKWTGTLPDKFIAALVTRVSQTNLEKWINDLSAFHTRHTKSSYIPGGNVVGKPVQGIGLCRCN
jgi:hypothetical protein